MYVCMHVCAMVWFLLTEFLFEFCDFFFPCLTLALDISFVIAFSYPAYFLCFLGSLSVPVFLAFFLRYFCL